MTFDSASDRDAYHLITMTSTIRTHNDAVYARMRLNTLRCSGRVTEEEYIRVYDWLDRVESGIAGFRKAHQRQRTQRVVPKILTADQRRRLAQHRKEPGGGGQ